MKLHHIAILMFLFTGFYACTKDEIKKESPPEIDKFLISKTTTTSGLTVSLWADKDQLTTGYNALYVSLVNSQNEEVSNLPITFNPIMDMGTMEHSSPSVQPVYNATLKIYEGAVIFTMASGSMGSWKLNTRINEELISFDLDIMESPSRETGTYMGTDGATYVVTLENHDPWKVGLNNFKIFIHKKESSEKFQEDNDFQIEFSPEMLSMGHGSPGNSSPVSIGGGLYQGKVNFTMTGDWRFNFKLKKNGSVIIENAFIDIVF